MVPGTVNRLNSLVRLPFRRRIDGWQDENKTQNSDEDARLYTRRALIDCMTLETSIGPDRAMGKQFRRHRTARTSGRAQQGARRTGWPYRPSRLGVGRASAGCVGARAGDSPGCGKTERGLFRCADGAWSRSVIVGFGRESQTEQGAAPPNAISLLSEKAPHES